MKISILIATYGEESWRDLAWSRAFPSTENQGAHEVLVFHDPEGSIASVRNELGNTATGDHLVYLDADDELAPDFLGAMQRVLEQEGHDGNFLLTPAVNAKGRFYPEGSIFETNWLVVGTLLRRSLFQEVGGFPDYEHGYEDWALWMKCVRAGARIVKVPNAVYRTYLSPNSAKAAIWRDPVRQVATHNRVLAELFPEA